MGNGSRKRLVESKDAQVCYIKQLASMVDPLYLHVPHPHIQPTTDRFQILVKYMNVELEDTQGWLDSFFLNMMLPLALL